ncbi:unnamed protein product [Polarella glacialis]|uniref:Uncharacterized protein n=1 Tax=Polarella glacialis TaxID=89957 RepID=A0A813GM62_POLGL|nr:unnamed protein product [Polarella glacialis]
MSKYSGAVAGAAAVSRDVSLRGGARASTPASASSGSAGPATLGFGVAGLAAAAWAVSNRRSGVASRSFVVACAYDATKEIGVCDPLLTCDFEETSDDALKPQVALRNSSSKALQCRMHSAVDIAVFYGSGLHRNVTPVVTDIITLQPDEKYDLKEDAGKGNVFFVEVLDDKGGVLEKYGRPDPSMPLERVRDGEYRKTLREMTSTDVWEIRGEHWGDPGALRNFTGDVFECRVFESEAAEPEGVTVRVLPWKGFNSFCKATRIEVLDGAAVLETWTAVPETWDSRGFTRKGPDEEKQPDDKQPDDKQPDDGIVSRLEPQSATSYQLHFLNACAYKLVVRGDKGSVDKEKEPTKEPVFFDEDEFNWFGILDEIYDNLASPGTSITLEVSCSAGKDVYVGSELVRHRSKM